MDKYNLQGLTLKTTYPIDIEQNPLIIPVDKSTVTYHQMEYGSCDLTATNKAGSDWCLFIWQGKRPDSLELFIRCLSGKCRLIKHKNIVVLLLKQGVNYGCLQVGMYIATPKLYIIQDLLGHSVLHRLDLLYEFIRTGGNIRQAYGLLTDFNGSHLIPAEPKTVFEKQHVYENFIKPFITDVNGASNQYEEYLELALADKRKEKVREYISQLIAIGISEYKDV